MTQIVAGFGWGWLVVAADRIVTQVETETGKVLGRWLDTKSKLMVTEGYPVVLTATGPGYGNDVIAEYIAGKTFTQETGAVKTAAEVWPLMCARHKEAFGQREYRLSGMTLFAGAVDSIGVPRVVTADYPAENLEMRFIPVRGGEMQWTQIGSAIALLGVHNARWDVSFEKMTPEQGVDATMAALESVLRIEAIRGAAGAEDFIAPPFDVVLITRDGAQWLQRAEV